jgi:hypothetical protein
VDEGRDGRGEATDPTRQCEARTKNGYGRRCLNHPLVGRPHGFIHMGPLAEWDPAEAARRRAIMQGALALIGPKPARARKPPSGSGSATRS